MEKSKDEKKNPLMTYKQYIKNIETEKKQLNLFIEDGNKNYTDFTQFMDKVNFEILEYEEYCDINGYRMEDKYIETKNNQVTL